MQGGDLAYALARIHARHGSRPDQGLWARLEASRSLSHFLQGARGSGLEYWTRETEADATSVQIEQGLRRAFRSHAREVAAWMPGAWRATVALVGDLAEAPLGTGEEGPSPLDDWTQRFWSSLPRGRRSERRGIEELALLIVRHRARLLAAERSDGEMKSWALDRELMRALLRHFRRRREEPATALCHLCLVALDLLRLRAALVERALLPDQEAD